MGEYNEFVGLLSRLTKSKELLSRGFGALESFELFGGLGKDQEASVNQSATAVFAPHRSLKACQACCFRV